MNKRELTIIGYGSPARVSTITNVAKIDSGLIRYIIDDSPLKQNRFSPGMHIKILPRKNNINKNIDIVLVFAYEYFTDIKKFFRKFKVDFYKPIPFSKLKWLFLETRHKNIVKNTNEIIKKFNGKKILITGGGGF